MGHGDDTDPVLRVLGAELERDDPRLAALLSGERKPRARSRIWLLLGVPVLAGLLLLPVTTAVGIVVVLLVVASPLVGCLIGPGPDDGVAPRHS
ncbi:MAG: hypothetical protein JWQ45_488 [Blastococcus sp.]|jgi:hypothetical protein|nr:hypothetical protein [Blastococcus sp.]